MIIPINSRERKVTVLRWLQHGEIDTSDVEELDEFLRDPFFATMKRVFVDREIDDEETPPSP